MKRILICEDNEAFIDIVKFLFAKDLIEVTSVTTGEAAVAAARLHLPDLILLDIMLPDINGYDILKRLKEYDATSGIPVLMTSGLEHQKYIDAALALGAVDYVTKPYNPVQLKEKVLYYL